MDKPQFHPGLDRVCRKLTGDWSAPAETFEEALAYGHYRAGLLGIRQIVRPTRSPHGMPVRWFSQSVRG